jgi:hypothetical protein
MNQAEARLRITDFGDDAEAITTAIGIRPTHSWVKKVHGKVHSQWELDSSLDSAADLDSHLNALLDQFDAHTREVTALCSKYQCTLHCAVYSELDNPGIALPPELVQRVAALGFALNLDVYFVEAEEKHEARAEEDEEPEGDRDDPAD